MALFVGLRAGPGRLAAGLDNAGRCSFRQAWLARKGKRAALRSTARNRKIWRPNLPGMANKPLKTYGGLAMTDSGSVKADPSSALWKAGCECARRRCRQSPRPRTRYRLRRSPSASSWCQEGVAPSRPPQAASGRACSGKARTSCSRPPSRAASIWHSSGSKVTLCRSLLALPLSFGCRGGHGGWRRNRHRKISRRIRRSCSIREGRLYFAGKRRIGTDFLCDCVEQFAQSGQNPCLPVVVHATASLW